MSQCPDPLPYVQPPPPPDPSGSNAGGWALLLLALGILVVEVWLVRTKRPTISQWVKRHTSHRPWFKALTVGLLTLLFWHLLEGGPI